MNQKRISVAAVSLILGLFQLFSVPANAQYKSSEADKALDRLYKDYLFGSDSALITSEKLMAYYDSVNEPCLKILALLKYASLMDNSDPEKGFKAIIDAHKLHSINHCDNGTLAWIFLSYHSFYDEIGEVSKADSFAKKAYSSYKKTWNNDFLKMRIYMALAITNEDLSHGIRYLDSAETVAKYNNWPWWQHDCKINKGWLYATNDSFEKARPYLDEGIRTLKKYSAFSNLHSLYNNIAGVLFNLPADHDMEILPIVDSALHYARLAKSMKSIQGYTENKAFILYHQDSFQKAYDTLYKALELKDSVLSEVKYKAVTALEQKYEAEKRTREIQTLKLENLNAEVENFKIRKNQVQLTIGASILLFLAGFFAYNLQKSRRNKNILAQKNRAISEAQERSDELLLNILPKQIADDLKVYGTSNAQLFEQASILFTDFIEFTQTSERLMTRELVEQLNMYFIKFDQIVEKYQIEKIKTIGDSYMAAGGLPVAYDNTVKQTILAALEMQDFVTREKERSIKEGTVYFEMRAGIHTGPVVAGIVGQKKYQYDVWGDTVNTASRMENNGESGKVNISQATYDLIKDDPDFAFDYRGKINAKGKGDIDMYFVSLVPKNP